MNLCVDRLTFCSVSELALKFLDLSRLLSTGQHILYNDAVPHCLETISPGKGAIWTSVRRTYRPEESIGSLPNGSVSSGLQAVEELSVKSFEAVPEARQ
jgi:hypothetical protein